MHRPLIKRYYAWRVDTDTQHSLYILLDKKLRRAKTLEDEETFSWLCSHKFLFAGENWKKPLLDRKHAYQPSGQLFPFCFLSSKKSHVEGCIIPEESVSVRPLKSPLSVLITYSGERSDYFFVSAYHEYTYFNMLERNMHHGALFMIA